MISEWIVDFGIMCWQVRIISMIANAVQMRMLLRAQPTTSQCSSMISLSLWTSSGGRSLSYSTLHQHDPCRT